MYTVINHPLIQDKLSNLRDPATKDRDFRKILYEVSLLMSFEVYKDLQLEKGDEIVTYTNAPFTKLKLNQNVILAPILRAGIGFLDGFLEVLPNAQIGTVGLFRDEKTLQTNEYCFKIPANKDSVVIVLDPMLATGNSAIYTINKLKALGYKNIKFVALIGCPEGVKAFEEHFPDVQLYLCNIDERLNEVGYILPGLGDAGDRLFGTHE
ncbi:MAG: uracil phosphoribosyltransferase [Bacilli bacterium]|nr:uracil phosphoribosyltransferase [Bacilli bacterium]